MTSRDHAHALKGRGEVESVNTLVDNCVGRAAEHRKKYGFIENIFFRIHAAVELCGTRIGRNYRIDGFIVILIGKAEDI